MGYRKGSGYNSGANAGGGGGGQAGVVTLVALGSVPSTPYVRGSKWYYDGKIYTATSTTTADEGVVPSYETSYLYNGTYYYWDGTTLQGADESNLVHKDGTETITGDKTFSGSVALGDNASAQTKATSDTSDAVATTKFVKDFAQDGEWQKPADWIDIRSGALENSVYFLVAHSKPTESEGVYSVATYPEARYIANVSNSGTYDVYVDGIKVATTASTSATLIDWATLYNNGTLQGGYDVMYPSEKTTHVVRITPSDSNNTLTRIVTSSTSSHRNQGNLWIHLQLSNTIAIYRLCGQDSNTTNPILEAVTAKNNKITYEVDSSYQPIRGLYEAFYAHLKTIPELESSAPVSRETSHRDFESVLAKKVVVKNNPETLTFGAIRGFKGEIIEFENPITLQDDNQTNSSITGITNLKRLPLISTKYKGTNISITDAYNLEPFVIDESFNDIRKKLVIYGNSSHSIALKGLIVSSLAPFDGVASQISVAYTAMDRTALVRLFNSMPTVSDGQVINVTGATGANDLTADDLAIASGKGWTVTR